MKPVSDTQDGSILNTTEVVWKDGFVTYAYDLVFKYQKNVIKNLEQSVKYRNIILNASKSSLINMNDVRSNQCSTIFKYNYSISKSDSTFNQNFFDFKNLYMNFVDSLSQIATNITDKSLKLLQSFFKISFIKNALLNYTYKNELIDVKKVLENECVKLLIDETANKHPLEWTKKDYKLLKLATHPDKCGNADDFITIQKFQYKIDNTFNFYEDTLEKLNNAASKTTKSLYEFNIGVKLIDTSIDTVRMWYEPTQKNMSRMIINAISL